VKQRLILSCLYKGDPSKMQESKIRKPVDVQEG
jgi:hypothetical protein